MHIQPPYKINPSYHDLYQNLPQLNRSDYESLQNNLDRDPDSASVPADRFIKALDIALPSAKGLFEKDGKIHESDSNRAFFVAEQRNKALEEEE